MLICQIICMQCKSQGVHGGGGELLSLSMATSSPVMELILFVYGLDPTTFSNEETGRKESSLTTKRFMPEIMETAWTKAVLSRGCNEEGN